MVVVTAKNWTVAPEFVKVPSTPADADESVSDPSAVDDDDDTPRDESFSLVPTGKVIITAWMSDTDSDVKHIQHFRVQPKVSGDVVASTGKGVQGKKDVFRRFDFKVDPTSLRATPGSGGWTVTVGFDAGKKKETFILSLGFNNRQQNPKYPVQEEAEIAAIIGIPGDNANKKKKTRDRRRPDMAKVSTACQEEEGEGGANDEE